MNNIKNRFSIKDLENLTGIKAHTIRIWEKRYNLLEPKRTDTNIRYYDLENFQKLLNVSYLNNNGYKISKIATIDEPQIPVLVKEIAAKSNLDNHAINAFKLSMLNFDQSLFFKTYASLLEEKDFNEIFYNIFIPLLDEIGLLWQTDTITPAHEHFLSSLIRQKILINTEKAQMQIKERSKKTFVLFLPENEIHELGLMFINYRLSEKGYHTIFLGQSVPLDSLKDILNYYDDVTYISYFTIHPTKEEVVDYLHDFENLIIKKSKSQLWVLGKILEDVQHNKLPKGITSFQNIKNLIDKL